MHGMRFVRAQHSIILATVACAPFLLSACTTLGPDYEAPEVSWLDDWQTSLYGQIEAPKQDAEDDLDPTGVHQHGNQGRPDSS